MAKRHLLSSTARLKWSRILGQVCSVSKVYLVLVSYCQFLISTVPICLLRRTLFKRGIGPLGFVERYPVENNLTMPTQLAGL